MQNATARGLGGGGSLFAPSIWLRDPKKTLPPTAPVIFVVCDMSGVYRSRNGGATWEMCDTRWVHGFVAAEAGKRTFSVAFDPKDDHHVISFHAARGLVHSTAIGDDGTWQEYPVQIGKTGGFANITVTAAVFTRDTAPTLLLGTYASGIWYLDHGSNGQPIGTWHPANIPNPTDGVVGIVVRDASANEIFAITLTDVLRSTDKGHSWLSYTGGLPAGLAPTSLAASGSALYLAANDTVYRLPLPSAGGPWSPFVTGLNTASVPPGKYIQLAATDGDLANPDVVYVSAVEPQFFPSVYRANQGLNWEPIYDGFTNHPIPNSNVIPGWIDEAESPQALGWGFGGAAFGLAVAPWDAQTVAYTNQAVVNITTDGLKPNPVLYAQPVPNNHLRFGPTWQQGYSIQTPALQLWRTAGLDTTTTWHYAIVPVQNNPSGKPRHFICSTDIGLSYSDDEGETWAFGPMVNPTVNPPTGGLWGNVYELADDSTPTQAAQNIWAAVSNHHDLPYDQELGDGIPVGTGDVLVSTNGGLTWSSYGATGLPAGPVVSLVLRSGVLYASVWGAGVYRSTVAGIGAWQQVGTLPTPEQPKPHCARIAFDSAGTLYCVVAAQWTVVNNQTVMTFKGGLYTIAPADTVPATTQWTELTTGLQAVMTGLDPKAWLAPMDFAFPSPPGTAVVYVCTEGLYSHGLGGIWAYDGTKWTAVAPPPGATALFDTPYNDGVRAFGLSFFSGVAYATSASHGIWCSRDMSHWSEYKAFNFLPVQRLTFPSIDSTGLVKGDPAHAPIYVSTFGGGAWKVSRDVFLMLDREVFTAAQVPRNGTVYVVFENFHLLELNRLQVDPTTGTFVLVPNATGVAPALVCTDGTITATFTKVDLEGATLQPDLVQRVVFEYQLNIPQTAFPGTGTKVVTLIATLYPYQASASLILETPTVTSPVLHNGGVAWLSDALRVFQIREGEAPFWTNGPSLAVGSQGPEAITYIKAMTAALTQNPALFSAQNFPTGETDPRCTLFLSQAVSGTRVFNFAIARVDAMAATGTAFGVQVFFRLFTTQVSNTSYDLQRTYRRAPSTGTVSGVPNVGDIALVGLAIPASGPQVERVATIPCFATLRVDTTLVAATMQTDTPNRQDVPSPPGRSVFFGCWLDFNQPTPGRYPVQPTNDGPYPVGVESIQDLIRGNHQCLVAEVFYPGGDPIALGIGPTTGSGLLAQRNLSIDESSNPGTPDTRTVSHSFVIGPPLTDPGFDGALATGGGAEDLLMIRWEGFSPSATATIHLPDLDAEAMAAKARQRSGATSLRALDPHTLGCVPGGTTLLPLPDGRTGRSSTGLLTVVLPKGVRAGQLFRVVVQQLSGNPLRVVGGFQFTIPVRKGPELLPGAERKLAVFRWIARKVAPNDEWAPVFQRYLAQAEARVRGLGGDPHRIPPSPEGGPGDQLKGGCLPRWVRAILQALGV